MKSSSILKLGTAVMGALTAGVSSQHHTYRQAGPHYHPYHNDFANVAAAQVHPSSNYHGNVHHDRHYVPYDMPAHSYYHDPVPYQPIHSNWVVPNAKDKPKSKAKTPAPPSSDTRWQVSYKWEECRPENVDWPPKSSA